MASILKRSVLSPIPVLLGDHLGMRLVRRLRRGLEEELCGAATDKFLELLLRAMDLAFCLSRKYRRNILGFRGRYQFRSADRRVSAGAVFESGNMSVCPDEVKNWNACVTFKDAHALRAFLLSSEPDILDALLNNSVEVDGNLNYVYRFGYLVNELKYSLGFSR
jgi:hypothetical protein